MISLRTDLLDTRIYICTPDVLMLFSDNFDYQVSCYVAVSEILQPDTQLWASPHEHDVRKCKFGHASIANSCLLRSVTNPYVVLDIRVYDCKRVCTCRTLSMTSYLECSVRRSSATHCMFTRWKAVLHAKCATCALTMPFRGQCCSGGHSLFSWTVAPSTVQTLHPHTASSDTTATGAFQ